MGKKINNYDFAGWATRFNIKCSDGRVIKPQAFEHSDGLTVPLVWNHNHKDANNVLGHTILEKKDEGVYAYGFFNETEEGQRAKTLVKHKDITSLSIYANKLKQNGNEVIHGIIREVSLVLAGANPGAYIDTVMVHNSDSDSEESEAIISNPSEDLEINHANEEDVVTENELLKIEKENKKETKKETKKEDPENARRKNY